MKSWASWGLMWGSFLALWVALDTWMPAPPWRLFSPPAGRMAPMPPKPVQVLGLPDAPKASPPLTTVDVERLDSVPLPPSWKIAGSARAWFQLGTFFQKLEQAHRMQVDVYHWGDSQIEGDRITGALREHFQKEHGGQGAGWVMPLTPAPTFAVRQSTTGGVRRVAGFGPRRDAEARRLPFLAVNRFDSASRGPSGTTPRPAPRQSGRTWQFGKKAKASGTSPQDRHLPPAPWSAPNVDARGRSGRQNVAHVRRHVVGRQPHSGPGVYVHNLAMRGVRAPCLTTSRRRLEGVANPHQPCPGGPSIRRQRRALHFQRERRERYAQKWPKHPAHQAQWPGCPSCSSALRHGRSTEHLPGLPHTVAALRHGLGQPCLHWDLQAVMGGPGAMARGWTCVGLATTTFTSRSGGPRSGPTALASPCTRTGLVGQPTVQPAKLMAP